MKLLEAHRVSRTLGRQALFVNLNLTLEPGAAVLLRGPNGSGKTTLLRALAGGPVDTGWVSVAGRPVGAWPPWEREARAPLVDQHPVIDLDIPAVDNLIDGLSVGGGLWSWFTSSRRSLRRRLMGDIGPLIENFGLTRAMHRPASELSYGQRRLLALVRALRPSSDRRPRVLLLDEPLAGLQDLRVEAVLAALRDRLATGWAVVAAEHLPAITRLGSTMSTLTLPVRP